MASDVDELQHAAGWAVAAPMLTASVFWVYNRFREEGGLSKRIIGLIQRARNQATKEDGGIRANDLNRWPSKSGPNGTLGAKSADIYQTFVETEIEDKLEDVHKVPENLEKVTAAYELRK